MRDCGFRCTDDSKICDHPKLSSTRDLGMPNLSMHNQRMVTFLPSNFRNGYLGNTEPAIFCSATHKLVFFSEQSMTASNIVGFRPWLSRAYIPSMVNTSGLYRSLPSPKCGSTSCRPCHRSVTHITTFEHGNCLDVGSQITQRQRLVIDK